MSDNDQKALEQITALLRDRLKHKISDLPSPELLQAAVRQMAIELFPPPRVVDVTVDPDGTTVHVRLELPFTFKLTKGCPDCKGPCHSGQSDAGHPCRCPRNCA